MKTFSAATLLIALLAAPKRIDAFACTGTTLLRTEAAKKDILIGSGAVSPAYLDDCGFSVVLSEQFNSLSPENEMKWSSLHPTKEHYSWDMLDRLVHFAENNNMAVKGHGLISGCCNPDYVLNITDPTTLRAAMKDHFETVMHRYDGQMDRWDVVTEALKTMGGGLDTDNHFYKVLGPGYIADAFRIGRAADADAKLFINEALAVLRAGQRQELYDLVSGLVADGVPIDGVALEMHITKAASTPGVITDVVNSYHALGLEVTISEMDVHTLNATLQADIYGAVVDEALHAGITDISFWGFTHKYKYTWVPGAEPLMFDEHYNPKAAFYATHAALASFVG